MSEEKTLEEIREGVKKLNKSMERLTKLLHRNEGLLRLFLWTMTFGALIWSILGAIGLYVTFLMMTTRATPMTYADALTSAIALSLLIAILVIIWAILAIKNTTYSTGNNKDNEEEESE
jgi:type VI protein secretion system component VasK